MGSFLHIKLHLTFSAIDMPQNTSDLYLEFSIAVCSRPAMSAKPLGILAS